jgi:hypothetical protein
VLRKSELVGDNIAWGNSEVKRAQKIKTPPIKQGLDSESSCYLVRINFATLFSLTFPLPSIAVKRAKYTPLARLLALNSTDLNPAP